MLDTVCVYVYVQVYTVSIILLLLKIYITVLEFILSSTSEVLHMKHLYWRPIPVLATKEKALKMTSESRTGRR